jgi:hypothetical protein
MYFFFKDIKEENPLRPFCFMEMTGGEGGGVSFFFEIFGNFRRVRRFLYFLPLKKHTTWCILIRFFGQNHEKFISVFGREISYKVYLEGI